MKGGVRNRMSDLRQEQRNRGLLKVRQNKDRSRMLFILHMGLFGPILCVCVCKLCPKYFVMIENRSLKQLT